MNINEIVKFYLYEMANLKQKHTGLPMIVWIDTPSNRNMKHDKPRLKFQPDTSTKNSGVLCSMSIEDEPKLLNGSYGSLKQKDINKLKQWVNYLEPKGSRLLTSLRFAC